MQGKTIIGFELKRLLGKGGMAEVWYAENQIHKAAAVKIINADLSQNDSIRERFRNEAEVMVRLNHPNIRQVYDFGEIDGRPAIVMEYLDGDDLKERLNKGQRFTDEELIRWWNQLVDALNYTHQKGVIHRDIKPGNIFVDTDGNIKLLDFGIAKVRESISATQTGQKLGTLMYMSPEQVKDSKHIDNRTDIYSLAVTFVHLITGKKPYDSDTNSDFEISEQIVYRPLDISGLPVQWRNFLAPYLEKELTMRPPLRHFEAVTPVQPAANIGHNDGSETMVDGGNFRNNVQPNTRQESGNTMDWGTFPSTPQSSNVVNKPKSKKGLWIGLGIGAAALAVVLLALLLPKHGSKYEEDVLPVEVPTIPEGAATGVFTVSRTDKVYFATGNLQYKASTDTWRIAERPWDVKEEGNENIAWNYNGWIDLFGWGTGDEPTKTSSSGTSYYSFTDWGSYYGDGWRTLTNDEWNYVLVERYTSSGIRYAKATVNSVEGLILLPDDWDSWTYDLSNTDEPGAAYSDNYISLSTWNDTFVPAGAVFLPVTGYRGGDSFYYSGGDYWSSTPVNDSDACAFVFLDEDMTIGQEDDRHYGQAVRLVYPYDY